MIHPHPKIGTSTGFEEVEQRAGAVVIAPPASPPWRR